jgi:gluconokinase
VATPLVLAIDVGSSAVKAALYDRQARLVRGTLARAPVAVRLTADGGAVVDPEAVRRRVEGVVDDVLARAGARVRQIAAVGLDTLAYTTCGVDADGHAVTPLYTYADSRSREDVEALARELDVAAAYHRTGCPLHTAYLPARLRWLRRTHPRWKEVRRWLDVASHLYGRWFGWPQASAYSMASWSGLLDRVALRWDAPLLRVLGTDEDALPALADYDTAQRGLARPYARRWSALKDVPFFLGVGDGAAANVGSGCVSARRLALTVGTTGAMRVVGAAPVADIPPGLWEYRVSAAATLLGGALNEGGDVYAWARAVLRLPPARGLERALAALPPDGHGLTVLPFLTGERSPGFSTRARAAIAGTSGTTSGLQMLQACLEAVAYRFGFVSRLLAPHLVEPHAVVASGGAMSASPYWVQLMADVLQHTVLLSRETELTSRGTAILALRALGLWSSLEDVPLETARAHEPDAERGAVYQAAMERQHGLYDALIGHRAEIGERLKAATPPPGP